MEVLLLGPLEVRVGGRPVKVPGNRPRALLALLALNAGRVLSADRLIELLWGDDTPDSAANALQVHIAGLRKILEPSGPPYRVLLTTAGGYVLRLDAGETDLALFERLVAQGHEALGRDDPELCARLVEQAVGLWRGSALTGVAVQPWLLREARRLEELRLAALEDAIDARLTLGRHADVLSQLRTLVAEHPLRERLRGQLMLALYRCGRQGEASDVYQEGRRILVDELGMEPGYELRQLLKAILNQDESLRGPAAGGLSLKLHNLPAPLSSFVGREREVAELIAVLDHERLVTVTGPGGIGKTRLAIEVGRRRLEARDQVVWLVSLAAVTDPKLVAATLAAIVGARPGGRQTPIDAVAARFSTGDALIVFDGCEHLVETCAAVVEELLNRCTGVSVLATSREPLGLSGELEWRLPPLRVPESTHGSGVERSGAVELFLDRAEAAGAAGFDHTALQTVARICGRLDGIPLALELAAARLRILSLDALSARLDDRFRVLAGGSRTALPRHQTLRAAMDWSYELLSPSEAALLRSLAVFGGSFGLDAVEAVCGEVSQDTVELLSSLVRKSMVMVERDALEVRYRLLDTVREYAGEKLRDSNQADDLARRHADFYLDLVERAGPQMRRRSAPVWIGRLVADNDNIRSALSWLAARRDAARLARFLSSLWWFWYLRCYFDEGRRWLAMAVEQMPPSSTDLHFALLLGSGHLAWAQGDIGAARSSLERAHKLARELGDGGLVGQALVRVALVDYAEERIEDAERQLTAGIALLRRHGPAEALAEALNNLGWLRVMDLGDHESGAPLLHEGLRVARDCGDQYTLMEVLDSLAHLQMRAGDFDAARKLQEECLLTCEQIGDSWGLPRVLFGFVRLALAQGDAERALRLAASAERFRQEVGMTLMSLEQALLDRDVAAATATLGADREREAWAAGALMTRSECVAYALSAAPAASVDA